MERLPLLYQQKEFWEFYCPICKAQRRSFYWPSPRLRHYVFLLVFSACLAVFTWPWLGVKGLVVGLPVWAAFEFFYRARARQSLICTHCGFDPYLYKFDVKLARDKVKRFFEEREKRRSELKNQKADLKQDSKESS